jgi:hypothetical protein
VNQSCIVKREEGEKEEERKTSEREGVRKSGDQTQTEKGARPGKGERRGFARAGVSEQDKARLPCSSQEQGAGSPLFYIKCWRFILPGPLALSQSGLDPQRQERTQGTQEWGQSVVQTQGHHFICGAIEGE